jgi:phosphoribosylformimino-5-aminoimidazole carboxamide ribonucleotide (ProFAR) isomerase
MGTGSNDELVEFIACRSIARVGGGVRSVDRARSLIGQGAFRIIVGTAAFNRPLLQQIAEAVGAQRLVIALDSKDGKVVVRGWQEATDVAAEEVIKSLEPFCSGFLCTYVDKEGMLEGTDLDWFRRLRDCTNRELTAAGGITTVEEIQELQQLGIHAALGMSIYTGRLKLEELARLNG